MNLFKKLILPLAVIFSFALLYFVAAPKNVSAATQCSNNGGTCRFGGCGNTEYQATGSNATCNPGTPEYCCKTKKALGQPCNKDIQCLSGFCLPGVNNCASRPTSTPVKYDNGHVCSSDSQCKSNNCVGGKCTPTQTECARSGGTCRFGGCGNTEYQATGSNATCNPGTPEYCCKPKLDDSARCTNNTQCKSNNCVPEMPGNPNSLKYCWTAPSCTKNPDLGMRNDATQTAPKGTKLEYKLKLDNLNPTGCGKSTYNISVNTYDNWNVYFTGLDSGNNTAGGKIELGTEGTRTDLVLHVKSPAGASGTKNFTVTAQAAGKTYKDTQDVSYTVRSETTATDECDADSQCGSGKVCQEPAQNNSKCVQCTPTKSGNCQRGQTCVNNVCTGGNQPPPPECTTSANCPANKTCVSGSCVTKYGCSNNQCVATRNGQYNGPNCGGNCTATQPECTTSADCSNNKTCENGACVTKYGCSNNQCVVTRNGQYNGSNCGGNCTATQPECTTSADCSNNNTCVNGSCKSQYDCAENQCVKTVGGQYNGPNCGGNCTPTVTDTVTPPPPPPPSGGDGVLKFTLGLHNLGSTGDSLTPNPTQAGSNPDPQTKNRNLEILFLTPEENPVVDLNISMDFNNENGSATVGKFLGNLNASQVGDSGLQAGNYILKVRSGGYLWARVPGGVKAINPTQDFAMPITELVSGDINMDNSINLSDFQIYRSCSIYSRNGDLCNSNPDFRDRSDINDDGVIDSIDQTMLQKEMSVRQGD